MVRIADADGDGDVSFAEFVRAYHSNEWFKVRLMNIASDSMSNAVTEQEQHYKEQAAELRDEGVSNSGSTKQVLMKRRALRRSREVRVAIEKFWKAIEYHTIDERWIPKELYYTYNIKLTKAVLAEEEDYDDEDDDPAEVIYLYAYGCLSFICTVCLPACLPAVSHSHAAVLIHTLLPHSLSSSSRMLY